ncbi:zinc-binding alcohol dehydrogenase family protein [Rhizobium sp. BE258]|uniref:quinone oxidoreductase family protein n=1 Tax=Rhizobium sp. BE258 TaxID=2817722 RepID=UPI000DD7BFC4|nr:zinc-binding alcohol dehydrogenase family protein [Rhizobium sp. BE258]MDR7145007.1 NADPH:quinone reductase-like Zn-dependent oxidoreductase [Rhizobium sp. BE258]
MLPDNSKPAKYHAIGYVSNGGGFPLVEFERDVPIPKPDEILIKVIGSSLNPLEFKLAELNFFGNQPPVALGFDVSGVVIAVGIDVTAFHIGDSVVAMADCNGNGGWAGRGGGGYAVAREFLAAKKPDSVSFTEAGVLPICFLAAFLGLYDHVKSGDVVYIPGGGGGVGHLAIQIAARALGAALVISSGSTPESKALLAASGADSIIDYKAEDATARVIEITSGRGADIVFDPTYSEESYVASAKAVRNGGKWIVLGVGPGRTSRTKITHSPVDEILAEKGAMHINANVLTYFSNGYVFDEAAKANFRMAMEASMRWHTENKVRPTVSKEIRSSVDEINAGLTELKKASGLHGKIAVNVAHS